MNSWTGPIVSWLAEVYLLSTVLLTAAGLAMELLRQPARRLVVARSALVALVLLALLAAGERGARILQPHVCLPGCCGGHTCAASSLGPAAIVLAAFAAGSAAMIAWLGVGAIASARVAGRSRTGPVPERLREILARLVGESRRPPRLIISCRVSQPVALGLLDPAIVLPPWFAATEPEGRIEAALAHEWTHIRNGDLWLLAISRLLLPLLFAHPLYAWLRRRFRADQEVLADAAGAAGEGRIAYAEALVCWSHACGDCAANRFASSLGLWGRSSSLTGRVALLLDRDFHVEPACPRLWTTGVSGIVAALTAVLVLVQMNGVAGLTLLPSRLARPVSTVGQAIAEASNPRWLGLCDSRSISRIGPTEPAAPSSFLCPEDVASLESADNVSLRCAQ